ncbi:MAG: ABATE domain-containing protein [Actinomycetota bacterium]
MPGTFPLLGEPLAVDLANTIMRGDDGVTDLLRDVPALHEWLEIHAAELPSGGRPNRAPSAYRLRELRDALSELFGAAIERRESGEPTLALVNDAAAAAHPTLRPGPDGPAREWRPTSRRRGATDIAAIARSAIDVLTGPDRDKLRRCNGPGCVLFFVAANPRRRWCSSQLCGNRVRVARHRHHQPGA